MVWGCWAGWGALQAVFFLLGFEGVNDEGDFFFWLHTALAVVIQFIIVVFAFGIVRGLYMAGALTLTPVGILSPGWFSSRFLRWDEIEEIEDPIRTGQSGHLALKGRFGRRFLTGGQANSRAVASILQLYFEAAQRNIPPQRLLSEKCLAGSGRKREFLPDLERYQTEAADHYGVTVSSGLYSFCKWASLVVAFGTFVIGLFVLPGSSLDLWVGWVLIQLLFLGLAVASHHYAKKLSTAYRVSPEGIEVFSTASGRIEFLEWEKIVEFQDRAGSGMAKVIAEDGRSINVYYMTIDYLLLEGIIFQKASRMRVTGKRWVVPTPIPEEHPEVATLSWRAPAPISEGHSEKATPSNEDRETIRPSRLGRRSIT